MINDIKAQAIAVGKQCFFAGQIEFVILLYFDNNNNFVFNIQPFLKPQNTLNDNSRISSIHY